MPFYNDGKCNLTKITFYLMSKISNFFVLRKI